MKRPTHTLTTLLIFISMIVMSTSLRAEDLIDQSANIFKFQQKLAMNGNSQAQYKLATMYEKGVGATADSEKAEYWYKKAADGGSASAAQRLTYIDVMQHGYDPAKHKQWLDTVIAGASKHDADSIYLLGGLYQHGIGVGKDLGKSLELYNEIKILGNNYVQKDIDQVRKEIAEAKETKREADRAAELEKQRQQAAAASLQKKVSTPGENDVKTAEDTQQDMEAKKRHYEAVMRKIRMEQKLIDEQQARVTGKSVSIDDEI